MHVFGVPSERYLFGIAIASKIASHARGPAALCMITTPIKTAQPSLNTAQVPTWSVVALRADAHVIVTV
jgi:hypothetical protein